MSHACSLKTFVYGNHDLYFFYSIKNHCTDVRCHWFLSILLYYPANPPSRVEPDSIVMRKTDFQYISAPALNSDKNPVEPRKYDTVQLAKKKHQERKHREKWKKIKDTLEKGTANIINDGTGCKDQPRPNPIPYQVKISRGRSYA